MQIDVNGIKITLSKDQLKEIDKQLKNIKTIDDINSYKDACEVLKRKDNKLHRTDQQELETIIEAVNYLDNENKAWKADFLDKNTSKYINYFEKTSSGWVFNCVHAYYYGSNTPVSFYFYIFYNILTLNINLTSW